MADIYHLLYTSRLSRRMTSKEFRELVDYSAKRNEKEHITGFLLERQGHFMQLLEGSEDAVLTCFTRIETDPRHGEIVIQADARSASRVVPNWSMNRVEWVETMPTSKYLIEMFNRSRDSLPYTHREEILMILQRFTSSAKCVS